MTTGDVFSVRGAPGLFGMKRRMANNWERGAISDDWVMVDRKGGGIRGTVKGMSRHSRRNLTQTMLILDYGPLFEDDRTPVMVTLTLPKRWQRITPNAAASAALLTRFQYKYKAAWGEPLVCVWKKEFQRRGAPHWHILMLPPAGRMRGSGETFREWLGKAWAETCGAQIRANGLEVDLTDDEQLRERREHVMEGAEVDPMADLADAHRRHVIDGEPVPPMSDDDQEFLKHVLAGTRVDEGNFFDPRRLAVYFAKHGLFTAKEYQNEKPESWSTSGRMWGYTSGLVKAEVRVEIDADQDYYPDSGEGDEPPLSGGQPRSPRPSSGGGGSARSPIDERSHHRGFAPSDITGALSDSDGDEEVWRQYAAEYVGQFDVRPKVFTERYLRRLSRENSYVAKKVVWRQKVDAETGEVKLVKRRVNRVVDHRAGRSGAGFVAVNDGIAAAREYARLFAWHAGARDRAEAAPPPYEAGRYLRMQEERRRAS